MRRVSEKGNVLWFILVGVVLIGALTMVLSRSGTSVDQSGDFEQMRIQATQLIRYAKSVETTIQQMNLRNVSENEISFQNTVSVTDYTNSSCDDDADSTYPGCMVFNVEGGGLTYQKFNNQDWIFTGANNVGTTAGPVGTTAARSGNDLMMLLEVTNNALCLQINHEADVDNTGTSPPSDTGINYTAFTGTYAPNGPTVLDGDPTPFELDGRGVGCFTDSAAGKKYFYAVVLAR